MKKLITVLLKTCKKLALTPEQVDQIRFPCC